MQRIAEQNIWFADKYNKDNRAESQLPTVLGSLHGEYINVCICIYTYLFTLYIYIYLNMQFETTNNNNNRPEIQDGNSSPTVLCGWL